MYQQPQNFLKRLLDAGVVSQDDLQSVPTNELRKLLMPGDSGGFVRREDGEDPGQTMVLNGRQGGAFDAVPQNALARAVNTPYPDQNSRAMDRQQPQPMDPAMAPPQPQRPSQVQIKMAGYGNDGIMSDLGSTTGSVPQMDMTRPAVDTPRGKGYYGKDGAVYVPGPDGFTKIIMGYDRNASMALNKADLERRKGEADILHTEEGTAASYASRTQKDGIPGMGIPQTTLEKQFGKAPEGQRWTEDGRLEDVPGSNGKPLSETQGKAAGFATRAQAAHDILLNMEASGVKTPGLIKQAADGVPLAGPILGTVVNNLPPAMGGPNPDQRKVEQAQRDFVNAVLRPESGASISSSEFDNARKQYFPQAGDDPQTIVQKQQAREREIAALSVMAGPAGVTAMNKTNASNNARLTGADQARALFDARAAIRQGANPAQVKQRLLQNGINPVGL